jgi:hypothetical protein
MEKKRPRRRAYKPAKFGEGLQSGTAEWELIRRQRRKLDREETKAWEARAPLSGRQGTFDPEDYWGPNHTQVRTIAGLFRWGFKGLLKALGKTFSHSAD